MKVPILAALAPVVLLASVVSVVAADLSPEDVQKAMHKGVAYLKDEWQERGKWTEYAGQEGGIKCLCTLALLNAGESPNEQVYLKSALESVRKLHPTTTYVIALQTMVLCRADQLARDQDIIADNVAWFARQTNKDRRCRSQRRLVLRRKCDWTERLRSRRRVD